MRHDEGERTGLEHGPCPRPSRRPPSPAGFMPLSSLPRRRAPRAAPRGGGAAVRGCSASGVKAWSRIRPVSLAMWPEKTLNLGAFAQGPAQRGALFGGGDERNGARPRGRGASPPAPRRSHSRSALTTAPVLALRQAVERARQLAASASRSIGEDAGAHGPSVAPVAAGVQEGGSAPPRPSASPRSCFCQV